MTDKWFVLYRFGEGTEPETTCVRVENDRDPIPLYGRDGWNMAFKWGFESKEAADDFSFVWKQAEKCTRINKKGYIR